MKAVHCPPSSGPPVLWFSARHSHRFSRCTGRMPLGYPPRVVHAAPKDSDPGALTPDLGEGRTFAPDQPEVRREGPFTIGVLARRTGVSVHTILYYERRGLLPSTRRSRVGYRLYSTEGVRRIRFIRQTQKLGFSLKEIEQMLTTHIKPGIVCDGLHERLVAKVADIDEKLRELRMAQRSLEKLVTECDKGRPLHECAVLKRLEGAVPLGSCSLGAASPAARR